MPTLVYYKDNSGVVSGPLRSNEAIALLKTDFFSPEHVFRIVKTEESDDFMSIDDLRSLFGVETPNENEEVKEEEEEESENLLRTTYKGLPEMPFMQMLPQPRVPPTVEEIRAVCRAKLDSSLAVTSTLMSVDTSARGALLGKMNDVLGSIAQFSTGAVPHNRIARLYETIDELQPALLESGEDLSMYYFARSMAVMMERTVCMREQYQQQLRCAAHEQPIDREESAAAAAAAEVVDWSEVEEEKWELDVPQQSGVPIKEEELWDDIDGHAAAAVEKEDDSEVDSDDEKEEEVLQQPQSQPRRLTVDSEGYAEVAAKIDGKVEKTMRQKEEPRRVDDAQPIDGKVQAAAAAEIGGDSEVDSDDEIEEKPHSERGLDELLIECQPAEDIEEDDEVDSDDEKVTDSDDETNGSFFSVD